MQCHLRTMMATLPGAEGNKPPVGRSGGSAGDAKRRERAARKLEQQETEAAAGIDDGSSMMTLKYSFQEPVGDIRITEDWSGMGTGWQACNGRVVSCSGRYMDCRQAFSEDHFVGRRVIEVGAGCGLTSIYTALRGADVTITDMDPAKCADNVDMNLDPRGLSGKASVRRLEWDCAAELAMFEPPYDIVIAGDCLYEEACISPLLKTMWALSGPNTEVLLSGVVGHSVLASFLGQARQYFELETVDTSKIDTLAEELPLGTLSDAAAVEAALARARATADPTGLDPDAATLPVTKRGPEEEKNTSGGGWSTSEGGFGGEGVESKLAAVAQLPGQRALMRLRKKCDAGAGE